MPRLSYLSLLLLALIELIEAANNSSNGTSFTLPPGNCYSSPLAIGYPLMPNYTCPSHFYCPNATANNPATIPQLCPASPLCQVLRLNGYPCEPQGKFEPQICPFGYYCPDYRTKIKCPENHFCPTGSIEPQPCEMFSSCPVGSRSRLYYGGFIFCFIVDGALLVIVLVLKLRKRSSLTRLASDVKKAKEEGVTVGTMRRRMRSIESKVKSTAKYEDNDFESVKSLLKWYEKAFESRDSFPKMEFKFENLGYKLKDGKVILKGVTGMIKPGKLTAIMGPSGAGKTTFMNVLMGKVKRTYGSIKINGKIAEISHFKKIIGYVPQEDIMIRELSVREIISHSATIRLPSSWSNYEIKDYVDTVIDVLGLSHVQHTLIGDETTRGVSGGQRKRVNIGIELAAAPLAIFADEPTSGLDSTAALTVAETLKNIARLGVTCVAVLHQPRYEIFAQFDDVLLLAPGGQTVYLGPQSEIVEYFVNLGYEFGSFQNPADVVMDILSGLGINNRNNYTLDDLVKNWESNLAEYGTTARKGLEMIVENEESSEEHLSLSIDKQPLPNQVISMKSNLIENETVYNSQEITSLKEIRSTAGFLYQVLLCHNRSLVQQYRLISSLYLEVGVALLAGALMGLATMSANGEMFRGMYIYPMTLVSPSPTSWIVPLLGLLIGMAVGLAGAPAGVKIFGEEKTIYWREAATGHNRLAYYVGKVLSVFYRFILTSLHFTAIFYFLAMPITTFDKMFGIIFLNFYCVYGLASVVSTLVRRENASLLAVVVCLFAATFCGFGPTLTKARDWGVMFIWEISYAKWTTEAMFSEEVSYFQGSYDLVQATDNYGYKLGQFIFDLIMALVIGSVLRVCAFILLIFTHRDKQK